VQTVPIPAIRTCRDLGLIYLKDKILTRALKGFLDVTLRSASAS